MTEKESLNPKTQQRLADMGINNIFIVGGTGAVGQTVEDRLSSLGYKVTRFAGADRFATNRAIMNFIPKEIWGPYPKIVNGYDWVQGLSVSMDTKFVYTSVELTPWVDSKDYYANYEDVTLADGTMISRRKTIKTTKTYINPIFTISPTASKPSDIQFIIDAMKPLDKWMSRESGSDDPLLSFDVDDNIFTNASLKAGQEYNSDIRAGMKVYPQDYINKKWADLTRCIDVHWSKLGSTYWAMGGRQTENNIANNVTANLEINKLYNDSLLLHDERKVHNYSSVLLTKHDNFIDSLSVSPLSAKYGIPIVLIDKTVKNMPNVYSNMTVGGKPLDATINSYKNINEVYYIGGSGVIPNGSEKFLSK